jgi:hypothetical protein
VDVGVSGNGKLLFEIGCRVVFGEVVYNEYFYLVEVDSLTPIYGNQALLNEVFYIVVDYNNRKSHEVGG